jgi:hypothetical protein
LNWKVTQQYLAQATQAAGYFGRDASTAATALPPKSQQSETKAIEGRDAHFSASFHSCTLSTASS